MRDPKREEHVSEVALARCMDYDEKRVEKSVRDALGLIGGMKRVVRKGDKVLLKVNILAPVGPEQAVTTHPSVVRAAIKLVKEAGGIPIVADSPGFFFAGGKNAAMIRSGIMEAAGSLGVEALQFESVESSFLRLDLPGGVRLKEIFAARLALESDVIISLPKLKTHSNTLYTGAVKNMFGAVAPKTRRLAHSLASCERFSGALVDIYSAMKPALAIMDAVVGMEGDGPRHGSPRKVGLVLASYDCVSLDALASSIIGFKPMDIFTTRLAHERGLGNGDLEKIRALGEKPGDFCVDFEKPDPRQTNIPSALMGILDLLVRVEPGLAREKCKKCGICAKSCPMSAIRMEPYPVIDRGLCIQCYCCNEMCPEGAMEIRRSWLAGKLSG